MDQHYQRWCKTAGEVSEKRSNFCEKISKVDKRIKFKRYKEMELLPINSSFWMILTQFKASSLHAANATWISHTNSSHLLNSLSDSLTESTSLRSSDSSNSIHYSARYWLPIIFKKKLMHSFQQPCFLAKKISKSHFHLVLIDACVIFHRESCTKSFLYQTHMLSQVSYKSRGQNIEHDQHWAAHAIIEQVFHAKPLRPARG